MLSDTIADQGDRLFRWRSYVLLGLAPLGVYAIISSPEPIGAVFGVAAGRAWDVGCIALAFLGLAIRAFTVGHTPEGTSGRNTKAQIAHTLNTTGTYSITRNPLYLANAIVCLAIALFTQSLMFVLVMGMFLIIYLERIIAAEERFLAGEFGDQYREWTERVPVFFPSFSLWHQAQLPFSFRNVLRREYSSFFAIIAAVTVIHYAHEVFGKGETVIGFGWSSFFVFGAVVYLTLRSLKKYSTILDVEGR